MTSERGADPWSGIPDDLRKAAERYGAARANICWAQRGIWTDVAEAEAELPVAEAALCAALRALVADAALGRWIRPQLHITRAIHHESWVLEYWGHDGGLARASEWQSGLAPESIDDAITRLATPRGAQEDAK